jgi:membrane protein DedA with SNARE-associated domain
MGEDRDFPSVFLLTSNHIQDLETMELKYLFVFAGALAVDIVPLPLPPAFTVMIFFQIYFDLNIWLVISVGVAGSVLGRYILTLYIPKVAGKIFRPSKNEDVQFLGSKLRDKGWKSQFAIFTYSLLPLPTTPLFIAGGMAKMKPSSIIPAFILGKFISDTIAVLIGKYATENAPSLLKGALSWESLSALVLGVLLIALLLFVDWRAWFQQRKFVINFKIWK